MVQEIKIEDFSYNLPDEKIPRHPLIQRDQCKLLLRTANGKIYHRRFKELADLLPVGTMLVCNDTKVINARLLFHKPTGAEIEIFILEPIEPSDYALNFQSTGKCVWKCLVGNLKKWKEGYVTLNVPLSEDRIIELKALKLRDLEEGGCEIEFSWKNSGLTFGTLLEQAGKIPIPPYLNRESEERDLQDYQTIYARIKGSVAAPTAGLHFTPAVFDDLSAHAIPVEKLTLHVGAGTFRPVKSDRIGGHEMHSEPFTISKDLISKLIKWKQERRPVAAVGTTTVRTLESLPYIGLGIIKGKENPFHITQWEAYESSSEIDEIEALQSIYNRMVEEKKESITATTAIMIAPGFKWHIVDVMVTNFHQPQSTLLLLVSSFLESDSVNGERDNWKEMYEVALKEDYRFLSYGDACLLIRD